LATRTRWEDESHHIAFAGKCKQCYNVPDGRKMTNQRLSYPKLRAVDARPTAQGNRPGILLRDPLQLSDKALIVPQPLHLVLALCDGTREDAAALSASLAVRQGIRLPPATIEQLLVALDEAVLLENDTADQAREQALISYREAPFRPPASAGGSYPEDAEELKRLLDNYVAAVTVSVEASDVLPFPSSNVRGLVSPHIDYARGGPTYARAWRAAQEAARAADLAVILGTDHYGDGGRLALTRQHYATPFGVLPTALDVVDMLSDALGEKVFAEELHHRSEHSVELAAVWLHHARDGTPCELVPILCGSFAHFIHDSKDPDDDPAIAMAVDALRSAISGRRALIVAAADLAHVGPAFGGSPMDWVGRARLQAADDALMDRACAGDAAGFLGQIRQVADRNNVCGVPPIYLALRLLDPVKGHVVAYDRCPADQQGTSLVSVCGIAFQ
jgi:AmmeMemoRadiSam system protein B